MVAPKYTPCAQLNDYMTSGTVVARRPPKMIALIGTPFGSSHFGESAGLFLAGEVKLGEGADAHEVLGLVVGDQVTLTSM